MVGGTSWRKLEASLISHQLYSRYRDGKSPKSTLVDLSSRSAPDSSRAIIDVVRFENQYLLGRRHK